MVFWPFRWQFRYLPPSGSAFVATTHNAVYAIDTNGAAWAYDEALGWQGLGGSFRQISAGLDAYGRDEFFAVGTDDEAWVHDNYGWHELLVNNTSGA
jgi:hypothetical protein